MVKLHELKKPFVVGTVVENDLEAAKRAVQGSVEHGAHAVELTLSGLYPNHANPVDYCDFAEYGVPVYTTFRRSAFMKIFGADFADLPAVDDERRMEFQKALFSQGLAGIDIETDTFDPNEDEWTDQGEAVERQMTLADGIRQSGGSVIFSWHPPRKLTFEQAASAVEEMRRRGADMVKIVEQTHDLSEVFHSIETCYRLRRKFPEAPFIFLALGEEAPPFRHLMTHFGASYILARPPVGGNRLAVHPPVKRALEAIRL